MSVLPIVERELRVAARRRGVFVARVVAAVVAVVLGAGQLWVESDWRSTGARGRDLFDTLVLLVFGFALVAGPLWTADTLSEERREGTLGLLFLTDLGAHDIVLGKLAAASVTALFGLLAVLPVLAISLLLGGVSLGEFGRAALVLTNALWFSLAVGMVMSAVCEQTRSAFALTVFVLFLTAGLLPWLHTMLKGTPAQNWLVLQAANPVVALGTVHTTDYLKAPAAFWISLASTHALGWLFLGGAAWCTARAWREGAVSPLSGRWRHRWLRLVLGDPHERRVLRERLLDRNPLLWLGSRHQLKRTLLWGAVAVLLAAWLSVRLLAGGQWWTAGTTVVVAFFLQVTLKWLAASEAAFRFAEDRRSGALELLLTSGLDEREIVRGQMLAMRRLLGVPAAAVLAVEGVVLASSGATHFNDWLPAMAAMIVFVWDLPVLAWTAMWYSVAGRRPHLASLRAIFRVLVVPWLIFLTALFMVGVWNWTAVTGLWFFVCAGSNVLAHSAARTGLLAQFREAAAGQLRPPPLGTQA